LVFLKALELRPLSSRWEGLQGGHVARANPVPPASKVPKGSQWGGFGEVITVLELAALGLNTDEPDSPVDRMRHAAMESVGAVTAG
jgi:hypothetical protein